MVIAYYMVKKAYDEGRTIGYAEGRAEARKKITADYHKRMQEAKERGEEFNEPPPRFEPEYIEGFTEGRAEAFADINRQNAAYYKRMQEARERGEEFNEPPPTFREDQGED